MDTRTVGKEKEELACLYLKRKGYQILKRNFSCRFGEIDIIARDDSTIVFIEVKYRTRSDSGTPEQAVTPGKRRKIIKTADYYRMCAQILEDVPCRFDIISVTRDKIIQFENAFDYYGTTS
ncbi:MAG: YraN family protein [Lachnospiraceae bacterium]|nr:YraN family protein [Lachnospiraceae bacterium]